MGNVSAHTLSTKINICTVKISTHLLGPWLTKFPKQTTKEIGHFWDALNLIMKGFKHSLFL